MLTRVRSSQWSPEHSVAPSEDGINAGFENTRLQKEWRKRRKTGGEQEKQRKQREGERDERNDGGREVRRRRG